LSLYRHFQQFVKLCRDMTTRIIGGEKTLDLNRNNI